MIQIKTHDNNFSDVFEAKSTRIGNRRGNLNLASESHERLELKMNNEEL